MKRGISRRKDTGSQVDQGDSRRKGAPGLRRKDATQRTRETGSPRSLRDVRGSVPFVLSYAG